MSQFKKSSPYVNTPINDWYLDIMPTLKVPKSDYDKIVKIPAEYDQRPDLLSQAEYGTPSLWWVFAVRNPDTLIDPINDFIAGTEIYVPDSVIQ
jgi:hypothetical protein